MKSGPNDAEQVAYSKIKERKPPVPITLMTVEEYDQYIIDNAVSYSAAKFLGRGRYEIHYSKKLKDIKKIAREMGPGTLIYAIDAKNRSVLMDGIRHEKKRKSDD